MASLLTGLLSGAAMQYLADEDASDKLKGNIIDAVSRKLYEIDIPNEEASIKKMQTVKSALVTQFGKNTADVFDNLGFTESGNLDTSLSQIKDYLEKYGETGDSFRNKVESFIKDKPTEFESAYGQTQTGRRATALEDRREHVNKLFSNTPYIRDLLIAPGQEQKGVMGKLFGGRVTPSTQIAARGRLEEATQVPTAEMPEAQTPSEMFGLTAYKDPMGGLKDSEYRLRLNTILQNVYQGLGLEAKFSMTEQGLQVTNLDKASQTEYEYSTEVANNIFATNPSNPNYMSFASIATSQVRAINTSTAAFKASTDNMFKDKGIVADIYSAANDDIYRDWVQNNQGLLTVYAQGTASLQRLIKDKYGALETSNTGYNAFFKRYDNELRRIQESND